MNNNVSKNEQNKQIEPAVYINTDKVEKQQEFNLSIIPVNTNKLPFGQWKQYQTQIAPVKNWHHHFKKEGYVGIITGKISGDLEAIDIDTKNDPEKRVFSDYCSIIGEELLRKLLIQKTPSGGYHFIYRCPVEISKNKKLAMTEDNEVIIETRGEGGYICHHLKDYQVIQGEFNLSKLDVDIPILSAEDREKLLTLARSLNRQKYIPKKQFNYPEQAINDFNDNYDIIELFKKHNWTIFKEDDAKVTLTRPDSNAAYSGYYHKDSKVFMCFSTSTTFNVQQPYNHFQVLQKLEGIKDYKTAIKVLPEYGYELTKKSDKITSDEIAKYLNHVGVNYDTFRQDLIFKGEIISEMVYNTIFLDMKKHFGKEVSRSRFEEVIKSLYIQQYNPIDAFIQKYKDRKPSQTFEKWLDCLVLKNKNIDKSVVLHFVKKWYVGLIAQALGGQHANEFFLTFLSVRQGIGKTTLLRRYTLPEELHSYISEHSLTFDDDFKVLMGQSILIIDDEMDGRTYDMEKTFKNILSTRDLPTRRKYDRRISIIKRRCSFAGSGNNLNVVRESNNRRVIPVELESIDREKLNKVDLVDLFMDAYNLYKSGFEYQHVMEDTPLLKKLDRDYIQQSDIDLILDEYVTKPANEQDIYYITNLDLVTYLVKEFPQFAKRINVPTIGKQMAERGFNSVRKTQKKITCYEISSVSKVRLLLGTSAFSYDLNRDQGYGSHPELDKL